MSPVEARPPRHQSTPPHPWPRRRYGNRHPLTLILTQTRPSHLIRKPPQSPRHLRPHIFPESPGNLPSLLSPRSVPIPIPDLSQLQALQADRPLPNPRRQRNQRSFYGHQIARGTRLRQNYTLHRLPSMSLLGHPLFPFLLMLPPLLRHSPGDVTARIPASPHLLATWIA